MLTEEFSFLSEDKKTMVHAVKWLPDSGEFCAILQITHGMVEYIERYAPFAEYLTQHGYMVVGHDHIGHGASVTTQEDWGYFGENPSDLLVADMHSLRKMVQQEYPEIPYFMMAHSMGSYMLRKYLTLHNENLKGAILMGTGFIPERTTRLGMAIAKTIAFFMGWHYRSRLLKNLTFDGPYRKYDLTGKDVSNSWLTKDEDIVRAYYSDPKCSYIFTINGYWALFEAALYDCRQENVDKVPKTLPLFLVSGQDDPVGNLGAGVKTVYEMFKKSGNEDLTYQLYEGDRHEILNETDNEKVYADILAWMNVRISA